LEKRELSPVPSLALPFGSVNEPARRESEGSPKERKRTPKDPPGAGRPFPAAPELGKATFIF